VNVLTAVVGDATDVENFDLESDGGPERKGGMGATAAAVARENEMLVRRQWSMVARGSAATTVGISTGCRRHLRRRCWCGERKGCWMKGRERIGSERPEAVEPFF